MSVVPSPYQRDLFAALAEHPGIELAVFYQEDEAPDSPWPDRPLQPYETILPGRWLGVSPRRIHVNWSLPDFTAFDVVILNTSYLSTVTQWLMRWGLEETPWIVWAEILRSQDHPLKEWGQQVLTAPFAEANALVAIGRQAMNDYAIRFPEQHIANIPYHCDLSAFQEASTAYERSSDEPIRLLCCGQMIYRKGIDLLLKAFEYVLEEGADATLELIGREADLPNMLQEVSPSTRKHVIFHGFQAPEDLPSFFARADVFVLPSRHDGWGVVVNQAVGAGLPIISTEAVGAAHDLVEDGVNGRRVPPADVRALVNALCALVTDRDLRSQYGQASRKKASAWTPERGADRWYSVVNDVCNAKNK